MAESDFHSNGSQHPGLANLMVDFNQMQAFMEDPLVIVDGSGCG